MANIVWTPPTGWEEEDGAHVSFKAPCDCATAGSLVIGSNSYSMKDACGNVITGSGGTFVTGAIVEAVLDVTNRVAYILSNGSRPTWTPALLGASAPTTSTAGIVGQLYLVTTARGDGKHDLYICTAITSGSYTWELIGEQFACNDTTAAATHTVQLLADGKYDGYAVFTGVSSGDVSLNSVGGNSASIKGYTYVTSTSNYRTKPILTHSTNASAVMVVNLSMVVNGGSVNVTGTGNRGDGSFGWFYHRFPVTLGADISFVFSSACTLVLKKI